MIGSVDRKILVDRFTELGKATQDTDLTHWIAYSRELRAKSATAPSRHLHPAQIPVVKSRRVSQHAIDVRTQAVPQRGGLRRPRLELVGVLEALRPAVGVAVGHVAR